MGLQLIGARKTKKAAEATGLDIVRLLCADNHSWYGIVRWDNGHRHVSIDPRDWSVEWTRGCFSSCSEGTWGPYVEMDGAEDGRESRTEFMYVYEGEVTERSIYDGTFPVPYTAITHDTDCNGEWPCSCIGVGQPREDDVAPPLGEGRPEFKDYGYGYGTT